MGEGAGLSDLCTVLVKWAVAGAEAEGRALAEALKEGLAVALALPESSRHVEFEVAPRAKE